MEYYQQNSGLIAAPMDEDLVMMDMDKGRYYSLNNVARDIWEMLESPRTLSQLASSLIKKYQVAEQLCAEQVSDFCIRLLEAGLIKRVV